MPTATSSRSFAPNRALLYPQFEAYKLAAPPKTSEHSKLAGGAEAVVKQQSFDLPTHLRTPSLYASGSQGAVLGHKEAKVRFSRSRLASGFDGQAAYVDEDGFVILIALDQSHHPSFHLLHRIHSVATAGAELPSLVCLAASLWAVSDGLAEIKLLRTRGIQVPSRPGFIKWAAEVVDLIRVDCGAQETQFSIVAGHVTDHPPGQGASIELLLQSTRKVVRTSAQQASVGLGSHPASIRPAASGASTATVFDVSLLRLPYPAEKAVDTQATVRAVKPAWQLTGEEPVSYTSLDPLGRRHLLGAEAGFVDTQTAIPEPLADASMEGNAEVSSGLVPPEVPSSPAAPRPLPYSWAQTTDTITIVFPLPPSLQRDDIRVHFSRQGFSASLAQRPDRIDDSDRFREVLDEADEDIQRGTVEDRYLRSHSAAQANLARFQRGSYTSRMLWAEIDTSGSVWTWERPEPRRSLAGLGSAAQQPPPGLLTLHLEKKHEGTRWSAVLNDVPTHTDARAELTLEEQDRQDDARIHETMDPSELLDAIEGLEKYTAELGQAGLGGVEQPSLLKDGLEDEDAEVGTELVISWVEEGEEGPRVSRPGEDSLSLKNALAVPMSSLDNQATGSPLVVRHDLDGLVFTPPIDPSTSMWAHIDTLPALSFVLASKRDARRVYVVRRQKISEGDTRGQHAVLAFEGALSTSAGSSAERAGAGGGAGNLFVYYSPHRLDDFIPAPSAHASKERYAVSQVLRLGVQSVEGSGALLGTSVVQAGDAGGLVLLCLCEREVVVVSGIL